MQLAGVALLPRTEGFTNPIPTVGLLVIFGLSYWLFARMIHGGANLGIMIPLMSTIIPLATVAIGVLLYGERASVSRIGVLTTACVLVGIASRL
jgi:multidrug transporter EmrE-like cation transporter